MKKLLIIFLFASTNIFAQCDPHKMTDSVLNKDKFYEGVSYKYDEKSRSLLISIKERLVWANAINSERSSGVDSPASKYIDTAANEAWSMAATDIIPAIYSSCPNTGEISVKVCLVQHRDIYGNEQPEVFASFEMTKDLEEKINWKWNGINTYDFPYVFPNFRYQSYPNDHFDNQIRRYMSDKSF